MRLRIILSLLVIACGHFAVGALTVKDLPGAGGTLEDGAVYKVKTNVTLYATGKSALNVEKDAKTILHIPKGVALTCIGADATAYNKPGQCGILLPKGAELLVIGGGRLTRTAIVSPLSSSWTDGMRSWDFSSRTSY